MKNSIEKKLLRRFLAVVGVMMAAVLTLLVSAMLLTRTNVSKNEIEMGNAAAQNSAELLITQSLSSNAAYVSEKADTINRRIRDYEELTRTLASSATYVYENPQRFPLNEQVRKPDEQIAAGLTKGNVMEWIPCDAASDNEANLVVCQRLGSLYGVLDAVLDENPEISLLYIVSKDGYTFGADDAIEVRAGINRYEARTQDYFLRPLETMDSYISPVYEDQFGKGSMITISVPIEVNGDVTGVFAADILVEDLKTVVLESTMGDIGGAMLFDSDGELICASDGHSQAVLNAMKTLQPQLAFGKAEYLTVEDGVDTSYVLHSSVLSAGWTLAVSVSRAQIVAPAEAASKTIDALTETLLLDLDTIILWVGTATLVLLLVAMASLALAVGRVCRSISRPVIQLTHEVASIGEGNLEFHNTISTDDEIELLGDSFEKMTVSLRQYIENLTAVTAEKERIGAELGVATHIQASMLPCIFPAFPGRPEFDIYATMQPAKEVGGDFYDFFLVDDDHLAMVMADVSGKGVPAALFMVIAKTLLKNCTQTGASPKAVLEKVNDQLCENNEAEMFVTVWLGILEISTGKMTCANAGHEFPTVQKANGEFALIRDKHGFVLAGMEGSRYREYELTLERGDRLFVYTDGVAEATDAQSQLYGTVRMIDALNRNKGATCEALLHHMKEDIDLFVGEAPQFDDITMLSLEIRGNPECRN